MERICAWCGASLGFAAEMRPGGPQISHGICTDCAEDVASTTGIPLSEYLESLGIPAVLADGPIGRRAYALATSPSDPGPGAFEGDEGFDLVYECAHSIEVDACGLDVHCSGCTIRHAALHTYRTGEPRTAVAATLRRQPEPGPRDVVMHISTRLVDGRVLVQIDEATPV